MPLERSEYKKLMYTIGALIFILGLSVVLASNYLKGIESVFVLNIGVFISTSVAATFLYEFLSRKIEQSFYVDAITPSFNKISDEIHTLKDVNVLYDVYTDNSKPWSSVYKEVMFTPLLKNTIKLKDSDKTDLISIERGHEWSTNLLRNVQEEDYIKAISFMKEDHGEWSKSSSLWEDYIIANVNAAKKCRLALRLFIAERNEVDECFKKLHSVDKNVKDGVIKIVKESSINRIDSKTLNSIFLDKEKFNQPEYTKLVKCLKSCIIIYSKSLDTKVAVIDTMNDFGTIAARYAVYITYNREDINKIEMAFNQIVNLDNLNELLISKEGETESDFKAIKERIPEYQCLK